MDVADVEEITEAKKRNKRAVNKLLFMKTNIILEIIGYSSTESDSKRLNHAVERFGGATGASVIAESMRGSEIGGNDLAGFFGAENAGRIEKKINQLGSGLPAMEGDLHQL